MLYFNGAAPAILGTTPRPLQVPTLLLAASQPTPYHNLGVPGATLYDVFNAYSSAPAARAARPFFDFINRANRPGRSLRQRRSAPRRCPTSTA